jgi:hypothetical protein
MYFLFFNEDASDMDVCKELKMMWISNEKLKLNGVDAWIIQSKHVVECKN